LRIAVADEIEVLDPLYLRSRAERLASRQVYEPLRTWQTGPFEDTGRRPGIVRSFRPDSDRTVWTAVLRRGVAFQSGEPLDADAVIVNVDRWIRSAAGQQLLPALTDVRVGDHLVILARTYEVVSTPVPRSDEIARRIVVRELG